MEEKNDGLVQEGEVVAWAGAVLVSKEDRDGGSTGDATFQNLSFLPRVCSSQTAQGKLWQYKCY